MFGKAEPEAEPERRTQASEGAPDDPEDPEVAALREQIAALQMQLEEKEGLAAGSDGGPAGGGAQEPGRAAP